MTAAPEPREDKTTALLRRVLLDARDDRIDVAALLEPLKRRAFGFLLLLLAIPTSSRYR